MTFAWYGFALEHPEDWAPVTLTGARKEGYVRIASPGRQSIQIRWKASAHEVDLSSVLSNYLEKLSRDAKAAKDDFTSDIEETSDRIRYQYSSATCGRGAIFRSSKSGRVFFIEAISSKANSLLPLINKVLDTFTMDTEPESWALFGLHLRLPVGLEVDKKVLQAGRTQIDLASKKTKIEAQRWAFAEQLTAKHGLEPWARSLLAMPNAVAETSPLGIRFEQPGTFLRPPVAALVTVQPERNQISTVKVTTREANWGPNWNWFA